MALVGPRPALWNQYDLLAEREQYGANSVRPGLTGWAQIHGRDELPIRQKAELDGYYVHHIQLKMDVVPSADSASDCTGLFRKLYEQSAVGQYRGSVSDRNGNSSDCGGIPKGCRSISERNKEEMIFYAA